MVILDDDAQNPKKIKVRFIEYTPRTIWQVLIGTHPYNIILEEEVDSPYFVVVGTILVLPNFHEGKPYKIKYKVIESVRVCKYKQHIDYIVERHIKK